MRWPGAKLWAHGVLGMNRRNAHYLLVHNARRLYPLVDDKVLSKELARKAGAQVPELFAVIEIQRQARELGRLVADRPEFVIKPAHGSQGKGIVVVTGRRKQLYRLADGTIADEAQLRFHVSNIIAGSYSLGGQPDKAIIEQRVIFDPMFEAVTYRGVPDIRIVVFLGVPVMAMIRFPTRQSRGRANLHQGAVGAGIDMATGRTLTAVLGNDIVSEHPDTGLAVAGIQIPQWSTLLELGARSYEMTGLGYQGIDIVFDKHAGPMILEFNARPGLNIQIANRAGLVPRLDLVERNREKLVRLADRVEFARSSFPGTSIASGEGRAAAYAGRSGTRSL
ncbi:MAG: alpha-L-glutamate ligase-like protein [Alphaproteobacteria bacterium]|nr:alpha-L-glutamate ligase-like protein [Alphaproteobacteria bacterium]